MESELLKEPWVFSNTTLSSPKVEEATILSTWEENFQDLSGWCNDTFQDQCDFHTGESAAFKLSGTKYEGNNVSTTERGLLKELAKGVTDDEKWCSKMDISDDTRFSPHPHHRLDDATSQPTVEGIKVERSNADCSISDPWSKLPKDAASYAAWSKQNDTDISAPFHPGYQIGDLDLDDACPTPFTTVESQRDTWDVLRTVETTGSDSFDLLSYLCDDEVRSTSTTSTAPTVLPRLRPAKSTTTTGVAGGNTLRLKSGKKSEGVRRRGTETRSVSSSSSSSSTIPSCSNTVVMPVRRSERMRTSNVKTFGGTSTSTSTTTTSERLEPRRGRKRSFDSDSSDQVSIVSYRESREKNNEASRKSRMNKKAKENEMASKAVELERDNRILKMKVEELEKLVTSMRNALLRSALKKEF